jgi:hypothetical protein
MSLVVSANPPVSVARDHTWYDRQQTHTRHEHVHTNVLGFTQPNICWKALSIVSSRYPQLVRHTVTFSPWVGTKVRFSTRPHEVTVVNIMSKNFWDVNNLGNTDQQLSVTCGSHVGRRLLPALLPSSGPCNIKCHKTTLCTHSPLATTLPTYYTHYIYTKHVITHQITAVQLLTSGWVQIPLHLGHQSSGTVTKV